MMKNVTAKVTHNNLPDSEAADEVCVFYEQG